jgi:hypothetical protein
MILHHHQSLLRVSQQISSADATTDNGSVFGTPPGGAVTSSSTDTKRLHGFAKQTAG